MIMRRCEKASKGPRWKVFLGVLSLSACLLVGSAIHVMFKAACVPAPPFSVITMKASAEAWTASESEKLYREAQAFQDKEISALTDEDFSVGIALYTRQGYVTKYIWDYMSISNACPMKQKFGREPGTGDHGKWVCGAQKLLQRPGCVVYSIGSDGLTGFEWDVVRKTKCEVHIFDPTLSLGTQQELRRVKEFNFHDIGLIAEGLKGNKTADKHFTNLQMQPLTALMADLGHTWIDVLKIDIEGWEWEVFESWLRTWEQLPFTQLEVEYHYQRPKGPSVTDEGADKPNPRQMLCTLQELQQRGFRLFNVEPNYWWGNKEAECMEFAYVQVDGNGQIVSSKPGPQDKVQ